MRRGRSGDGARHLNFMPLANWVEKSTVCASQELMRCCETIWSLVLPSTTVADVVGRRAHDKASVESENVPSMCDGASFSHVV